MSALTRWLRRAEKLRTNPHKARFLASRALWHSGLSPRFTIPLADGLRLRFYPSSVSAALWVEPASRDDDVEFLRLVLRPGDRYIDCGANIGHLAVVARHLVGAAGTVTAIEPNPRILVYCANNLKLNGFDDVVSVNAALGEVTGTTTITDRRDDNQNHIGDGTHAVPLRPLDDVIEPGAVSVLKLDVEGYELQVLRGAPRTLADTRVVYCELSAGHAARFGYQPREIEQLLLARGFVFALRDDRSWRIERQPVFDTIEHIPRTGFNLVAVAERELPRFGARLRERGHSVTS